MNRNKKYVPPMYVCVGMKFDGDNEYNLRSRPCLTNRKKFSPPFFRFPFK